MDTTTAVVLTVTAVAWARSSYRPKAVETPGQEAFIAALFDS